MSASSDYLRVLTDITREGGATRAATARANAQIWGGTVAKLGDFASDAIKQYSVDKKAKKQEQEDQAFKDLFSRASQEFQAQQQPSMAELTGGTPTPDTYTPGGLQGSFAGNVPQSHVTPGAPAVSAFTGPELKGARPPRSSPFPTPSEILSVYPPQKAIPVINAIAALHKLDPKADDTLKLEQLQTIYKGLDKIPEDQRAAYFPGLIEGLEQVHYLPPGQVSKEYNPATWTAIGSSLKVTPTTAKADYTLGGQRFSGETNTPIATATVPSTPERPANLGSFEDYVQRWAKDKGKKPEDLTPADIELARKAYNQSDDRAPAVRVNVSGGGAGTLTPEAVEDTATRYRILGTAAIPTRIEAPERVRIMNEAAKQQRALGQTAAQAVQKQAAFKSDAASLTQMTKMASSAEAFETKALAQTDLISDLSKKVPRSASPLLNDWWLSGKKTVVGDKNTSLLFNALDTFTSEYAKIMSGSTGSVGATSDAATRKAEGLVSAAMNKGTLQATLDQMKWEMDQTRKGYDATIAHITDRMGGSAPSAAPIVNPTGRFNPVTGKVEPIH